MGENTKKKKRVERTGMSSRSVVSKLNSPFMTECYAKKDMTYDIAYNSRCKNVNRQSL